MAESIRFSVGAMGSAPNAKSRIGRRFVDVSLGDALAAIRNLPISEEQKKSLSSLAKKVPSGSLGSLLSNYQNHLEKP